MKKIVIVADDYGFSKPVNRGIEASYIKGMVTEVSLMVYGQKAQDAVEAAEKLEIDHLGIHVELLGWEQLGRPVTLKDYLKLFQEKSYEEVNELAQAELERFISLVGKKPTHITTHKGIHGNLKLLTSIVDYAKSNSIPVRLPNTELGDGLEVRNYAAEVILKRSHLKYVDHLLAYVKGSDSVVIKERYLSGLKEVGDGETVEILIHPAYFDKELLKLSSLNYERSRDLAIFTDGDFKKSIQDLDFKLVGYGDL